MDGLLTVFFSWEDADAVGGVASPLSCMLAHVVIDGWSC